MKESSFLWLTFPVTALLVSCSSAPKTGEQVPISSLEPDYVLRERYPAVAPEWAIHWSNFKRQRDGKGLTFYMGESGDVADRVAGCDVARLEAKRRIAEQIATLFTEKIAASKAGQLLIDRDNPSDPGLRRHFEVVLAAKSMAFLTGVQEYEQYWEERDYSRTGGRRRVYQCKSVVTIDDKNLSEALRQVASRGIRVSEDPEAKAAVKEALKDLETEFKSYRMSSE